MAWHLRRTAGMRIIENREISTEKRGGSEKPTEAQLACRNHEMCIDATGGSARAIKPAGLKAVCGIIQGEACTPLLVYFRAQVMI